MKMPKTDKLFLDAYKTMEHPPKLVPGGSKRDWMDDTVDRFAYRCLPLTMANASGWDMTCPYTIDMEWNGGPEASDLIISSPDKTASQAEIATSHFKTGIVTFHTGYLFKTPPGWAVWCMGPPNWPKDGIYPLSGVIETDWLPFTFTMNWQMTRPGKVRFERGEPFCFITMVEHNRLEEIKPVIRNMSSNKELAREYKDWSEKRTDFAAKLENLDPKTVKEGWQRHYMQGGKTDGSKGSEDHKTKRRLQKPRDVTGSAILKM